MRQAKILINNVVCGHLNETDSGFQFAYDADYLALPGAVAISLTLPLRQAPYNDKVLMPFFDGLIPEGWLLEVAIGNWKINERDRMGLLMVCCRDCIGNVSIQPILSDTNE